MATTVKELRDLCNQVERYTAWTELVAFCKKWYGENAVRAECEIDGEYDDEGGTDWYVRYVTCYNVEGNTLPLIVPKPTEEDRVAYEALDPDGWPRNYYPEFDLYWANLYGSEEDEDNSEEEGERYREERSDLDTDFCQGTINLLVPPPCPDLSKLTVVKED